MELLLHPIRLRIVQTFLGDRTLTTGELSAELSDVPVTSLYRHVARLAQAGVLGVVAERRVRGTLERTYQLHLDATRITPEELATLSPEDHRVAFLTFAAGLVADFERYLARGDINLHRDGASYLTEALWLSDEEYVGLIRDLAVVLDHRRKNEPRPGRRRRMLSAVWLPDETEGGPVRDER